MFGHKAQPSRIFSYKVKSVLELRFESIEQMRRAHRYHNTLIEIERRRRDEVAAVVARHHPDVPRLQAAIEAADAAVKAAEDTLRQRSQRERTKVRPTAEERRNLAALRAERRQLNAEFKAARQAAYGDDRVQADLKAVEEGDLAARIQARSECGLYWGTYLLVEQAAAKHRKGAPPRFRRWEGEGTLAVQCQGGLDWHAAMLGEDQRVRVRIEPLTSRPHHNRKGVPLQVADPQSQRSRTKAQAVAWLRVGTVEGGRAPVWAKVRFHLHRQPPPETRIKWAYLHRMIVGGTEQFEVQFVLAREEWEPGVQALNGTAGIDVNWRLLKDGLRVASAVGDDGEHQILWLPREWLSAWERVETLRSTRDGNLDRIKARLAEWLAAHEPSEWLAERLRNLAAWRSHARLRRVVWDWREQRFEGDEAIFAEAEAWRKQDRHLHDWEAFQHRKAIRRRDDHYRKFARAVAAQWRQIKLEAIDWKALRARAEVDEEDAIAPRLYARIAAPGRLCELIREAAAEVVKVDPKNTTRRCHACGKIDDFDQASEVFHTCSGCGQTWDQDVNAALNLRDAEDAAHAEEVEAA